MNNTFVRLKVNKHTLLKAGKTNESQKINNHTHGSTYQIISVTDIHMKNICYSSMKINKSFIFFQSLHLLVS